MEKKNGAERSLTISYEASSPSLPRWTDRRTREGQRHRS